MTDDRIEGAVTEGVGRVQDAFGGLTGDAKTQGAGKLNEAKGSIQNAYGQVKDQTQAALGEAADHVQDTYENLQDQLRNRPLLAVGIGLGLGFASGLGSIADSLADGLAGGGRAPRSREMPEARPGPNAFEVAANEASRNAIGKR